MFYTHMTFLILFPGFFRSLVLFSLKLLPEFSPPSTVAASGSEAFGVQQLAIAVCQWPWHSVIITIKPSSVKYTLLSVKRLTRLLMVRQRIMVIRLPAAAFAPFLIKSFLKSNNTTKLRSYCRFLAH